MELWQLCIIWYIVFVFSIVFHEFAHAIVAYRYGDDTALHHGLTTLNPVPHIQRSPFGMVIIPLLSFVQFGWMIGWASTPYDPYWARRYPKEAAAMALAGPAANLILVIVAGILIHIGIAAGIFAQPPIETDSPVVFAASSGLVTWVAYFVNILFLLNLLLLIFNLIPVPPLDGTAWMELVLQGEARYKYQALMTHPTMRIFGIFIAWYLLDLVFDPIYLFALNALYINRAIT